MDTTQLSIGDRTIADVARATGLTPASVCRHVNGKRNISARSAIIYEKKLGIPRSELRPDLWPPDQWQAMPIDDSDHLDRQEDEKV